MPVAALADMHGSLQALEPVLGDRRFAAADRVVETLLRPPTAEEATAHWEATRLPG
jgi:hypothetical protein